MKKIAIHFTLVLPFLMLTGLHPTLANEVALSDNALYQDVRTYSAFGNHRYGSVGEREALAWLSKELAAEGLAVETQPLTMARQLLVEKAQITLGEKVYEAFPHWWPPEQDKPASIEAPLKPDSESSGAIAWLRLPYERGAYLNAQHRQKIMAVAANKPLAILLTIDNPAGSLFTYNVNQEDAPWPVPVVVVPSSLAPVLETARLRGEKISINLATRLERDVHSHNVIGRIDNGAARTIVVSTPVSSWFTSSCERGPGIALFLAMARHVAKTKKNLNYVFVATVGHEIGHGGMEAFIHDAAPKPARVRAWLHFGASLACYGWKRDPVTAQWLRQPQADPTMRALLASESLQAQAKTAFADVAAIPMFGAQSGVGELRDVRAAGYVNYLGMAGLHRFFHTPEDDLELTGPELLSPLAKAFAQMLDELASE